MPVRDRFVAPQGDQTLKLATEGHHSICGQVVAPAPYQDGCRATAKGRTDMGHFCEKTGAFGIPHSRDDHDQAIAIENPLHGAPQTIFDRRGAEEQSEASLAPVATQRVGSGKGGCGSEPDPPGHPGTETDVSVIPQGLDIGAQVAMQLDPVPVCEARCRLPAPTSGWHGGSP